MQISCCPICGLPWSETLDFEEVDRSFDICHCCGCEYGYDDIFAYRQTWLERGAPWFNKKERPSGWNLQKQLKNIIPNWDEIRLN